MGQDIDRAAKPTVLGGNRTRLHRDIWYDRDTTYIVLATQE